MLLQTVVSFSALGKILGELPASLAKKDFGESEGEELANDH